MSQPAHSEKIFCLLQGYQVLTFVQILVAIFFFLLVRQNELAGGALGAFTASSNSLIPTLTIFIKELFKPSIRTNAAFIKVLKQNQAI